MVGVGWRSAVVPCEALHDDRTFSCMMVDGVGDGAELVVDPNAEEPVHWGRVVEYLGPGQGGAGLAVGGAGVQQQEITHNLQVQVAGT